MDHRVDPAITVGLGLGETPVIRNAGGRGTQAVIDDIAFLRKQFFWGPRGPGSIFEVAIIHHTQCAVGFLADPGLRRQAADATGIAEATLEASAVPDPYITVRDDVEHLPTLPSLSPKVSVSGHVYDIAAGRLTTLVEAQHHSSQDALTHVKVRIR
jgi:carbonic anhydrase